MRIGWASVRSWAAAGLLAAVAVGGVWNASGFGAYAQTGDVTRLARRAIGGPGGEQAVGLLAGQLAPSMLQSLPLPTGTNVVGTVVRDLGNGVASYEVVLDTPTIPIEVGAFFERTLPGLGWQPVPNEQGVSSGLFCQGEEGPWIGVVAVPTGEQMSDVRLRVEVGSPGPCAPQTPPR